MPIFKIQLNTGTAMPKLRAKKINRAIVPCFFYVIFYFWTKKRVDKPPFSLDRKQSNTEHEQSVLNHLFNLCFYYKAFVEGCQHFF